MTTTDNLLASVREIEPLIREHSAAAELDRRLSEPVAKAMLKAGLYRMFRPEALGGLEVEPITALQVIEEVARIDSAAAWNLQISTAFDMFGPWFGPQAAREIFTPDAIIGGAFNPPRKAVPTESGYRVSGRTPFVSGAHQATAFLGLANIFDDDGQVRMGINGVPETILTAFLPDEVEIIDNWNTLGMCGTGSHDVTTDSVLVPHHRAVSFAPLERPGSDYAGPLYRLTIWPATAVMVAPAFGIARAAIEAATELATTKAPAYTAKPLKGRAVVQSQFARAEAMVGSSRAYLYEVFAEAWRVAVTGGPLTNDLKAKIQLASTTGVLQSAAAVDLVHEIVGASGIRQEYPYQKHFRDIHVITQHGFVNASKLESVGQIMLGLTPEWPFFAF